MIAGMLDNGTKIITYTMGGTFKPIKPLKVRRSTPLRTISTLRTRRLKKPKPMSWVVKRF